MAPDDIFYTGLAASEGVACAPAFILNEPTLCEPPRIAIAAEKILKEVRRFEKAVESTRKQLQEFSDSLASLAGAANVDVFEAHRMVIDDQFFRESVINRITSGCNAEYAVFTVLDEFIGMLMRMGDSYIRDRSMDFQDIRCRLMANLEGKTQVSDMHSITEPCVLVADELSPSETVSLPKEYVRGIVVRRGNVTSHSAVLARALGVPAVVGVQTLPAIQTGEMILLDGFRGQVHINPPESVEQRVYDDTKGLRQAIKAREKLRDKPAITPDGVVIKLMVNTDHGAGFANLLANGAEGIGLYRTEYLWLSLDREPTENEQTKAYEEAIRAAGKNQVVFRVLDIGGDKSFGGDRSQHREANPFLGLRSVRYLLRERAVFRRQLRAILRASACGEVAIMLPMITDIDELHASRVELETVKRELESDGIAFRKNIPLGVMIEVPSAALIAPHLAESADFFSIGTNDLIQYTLAVDRGNESIANLYRPLHPAVLKLIKLTVAAGKTGQIPVSVCGEMAGDPVMVLLLIGLGIRVLSMSATSVLRIKEVICNIPSTKMEALAKKALSGKHSSEELMAEGHALVDRYIG